MTFNGYGVSVNSMTLNKYSDTRWPLFVIVLAALSLCAGCAFFGSREEKSAQELAADGMEAFSEGKYRDAIESFEQLRDWYPFSKFAILAELKLADGHYHLEEYEEAIFAYEEFENLHPRNEATPYVVYQIGRCYFDQIDTIDRDQTTARKALETFRRQLKQFPGSTYASQSREHIKQCLRSLAGHDFYVGMFYYRAKRYPAALSRFKTIVTRYPDVGLHHEALAYIARCEALIEKTSSKK